VRRRHRIALVATALTGFAVGVWALTSFNVRSEGPIASLLERVGSAVGSLEHKLRGSAGGSERSRRLAWLERYRKEPALLRRPQELLLGAYDGGIPATLSGIEQLEESLGTTLPLIQFYSAWGDKPEQQFPLVLVNAISDLGSIPVITWEPWLSDFESGRHPHIALRDVRESHGMASVARGDYDFYIDAWARAAARFGRPLLVRLGHEMNDAYRYPWGPQNNTKEEFIAAWRHVVERFRAAGAGNVLWVWSPHVAYEYWELYYPGETYVDWVATGVLNFGPIAQWSRWWTFDEIFGTKYPGMAEFGKPIMIAEFGSLAVGGDRTEWYTSALADLRTRYPAVAALLFFNVAGDQTVTYQKVDWTFLADSGLTGAVAKQVELLTPPGASSR
jgi:hypothetical protein